MLGSPILYLKGMRAIMFQLSGFYYIYIYIYRVRIEYKPKLLKPSILLISGPK